MEWQVDPTSSGTDATTGQPYFNTSAYISDMVGDTGSGGEDGLVPAPGAGDAAAHKYLDAAGTWSVPSGSSAITALTGDVTASGPGSATATLANTGVTTGTYTSANITVDAKGRVTAAANGGGGGGTHSESLTDGNSNFIFAIGDIVTIIGVPN